MSRICRARIVGALSLVAVLWIAGLGGSAPSLAGVQAPSPGTAKIVPSGPSSLRFPADFPARRFRPLLDSQWGFPIGGFGGLCRNGGKKVSCLTGQPARCTKPRHVVIFVHGNTRDASDWGDQTQTALGILTSGGGVHQAFIDRGYCDAQLWAFSYDGQAPDLAASVLTTEPHANDEANVPDLLRFLQAVKRYTAGRRFIRGTRVDIVAHSLGVTIVRRMFYEFPETRKMVRKFVAIDGANHGTTICRGLEEDFYGCDEIAPGSYWLNQMNGCGIQVPPSPADAGESSICLGADETFGVNTLVIHNNDGTGVDFFFSTPDQNSALLAGAPEENFPGLAHDELRFRTACNYINYLLSQNRPCPLSPTP